MSELKKLGRYEIKGVLGKGAMGLVYDGVDPQLSRRVAIKTIITKNLDEATAKVFAVVPPGPVMVLLLPPQRL